MASCIYLIYEAGNFRPALELCCGIRDRTSITPILFSPYHLPDTASYVEIAAARGVAYIYEATEFGGDAAPLSQLAAAGISAAPLKDEASLPAPGLLSRGRAAVASRLLRTVRSETAEWIRYYESRFRLASRILGAAEATVLLLPEDNVERDSACWIHAARARGGRSLVISSASITPHEAAIAYFANEEFSAARADARRFARIYPRWQMTYKKRRMLRLPVGRALAMEQLGIAPEFPWVVNTGAADSVVVESEFMADLFAQHGISKTKITVLGNPSLDVLWESAQRADQIRVQWQRDDRPVLLCAMPPNQYPGVRAPEFDSYEDLLDVWLRILHRFREHFFAAVSPHPNIQPEHVERIREAGLPVLTGGVSSWLPACDLYLASVSSTIKWARACGKPVLNYDCYRYDFDDYRGAEAVTTVFDHGALERELTTLTDRSRLLAAVDSARRNHAYWGVVDGGAMTRLVNFVAL